MAQILIIAHAALGGIALASGILALTSKKGGKLHVRGGRVFFWAMLISALLGVLVSVLPGHWNPFLMSIGIFSTYLISSGYLAVRYKKRDANLKFDYVLSLAMLVCGLSMIVLPLILSAKLNIILSVFGAIGFLFALSDLRRFRNPTALRKRWLGMHLSKMTAGYIAAVTAFIVVNDFLPNLIGWLGPSAIGTAYIVFWMRKVEPRKREA